MNFQKSQIAMVDRPVIWRVQGQLLLYNIEYSSVVSTFIGVTLYVETPVIGVELLFSAV